MSRRNRRRLPAEKRRARRRRRLLGLLRGLVLLVVLSGLGVGLGVAAYAAFDFLNTSPALSLRSIEVRGVVHTPVEQVLRAAGLQEGMNIFSVVPERCARSLRRLPWVRAASVQRLVPDRVVVEIEEYRPAALLAAGDTYLVDGSGVVFKRACAREELDLPLINGLPEQLLAKSPERAGRLLQRALSLLASLRRQPCLAGRRIAQLHLDELLGPALVIDPGALVVELGPQAARHPALLCQAFERLRERHIEAESLLISRSLRGWQVAVRPSAGRRPLTEKESKL